ncbi:MAG: 4Fe-4S binding protein [Fimbriimonadales bacterium]
METPGSVRRLAGRIGRWPVRRVRRASQVFSSAVSLILGVRFALWADQISSGVPEPTIARPAGVEGWLPISALVSLRHWIATGEYNLARPAGLAIFLTILAVSFLFRKGFCGWLCPIGFLTELLGEGGRWALGRNLAPPRWLDYPLRSLKYLLLGFFLFAIFGMDAEATTAFVYGDYNAVADILMLRFFTHISPTALGVLACLAGASFFVRGFWCRYLCPYGALLGQLGLASPSRIVRRADACIACRKCARVCPSRIPVDAVREVRSDECIGCMECVAACPVRPTLRVALVRRRWTLSPVWWGLALVAAFWGTILTVRAIGPWQSAIPNERVARIMAEVRAGRTPSH